ncbi:VWA domain-containing protein [soil metagenome]
MLNDLPPGLSGAGPYRYARWDGTQQLADLMADDVLDALSDDLIGDGDLEAALQRLMERGMAAPAGSPSDRLPGLRDLLQRLAAERDASLERYHLGDVLTEVRDELDALVAIERRGIERRFAGPPTPEGTDPGLQRLAADVAARRQASLDALPDPPGERIRALRDYDFLEPAARERFEALLDRLGKQVLDAWFDGLSEVIQGATPERLAAEREMVHDLDGLLQERLDGREPDQEDVDRFLSRHGSSFPGARTLDDIVDQLAARMAAMQSLLASMTAAQRAELRSMMDALLRDDRLRWDLAHLASTLDQLLPQGLGERMRFSGQEPLSLDGALGQLERLGRLDRLAGRLAQAAEPGPMPDIDPAEMRDLLGDGAARDFAALQELARRLEEAGYAERLGGRLELTPRGTRRIGQRVLDQLFARLRRDAFGDHARDVGVAGGEPAETAVPYEFGRPFHLDLQRTLSSALARPDNAPARGGQRGRGALTLEPSDFAVRETEELDSAATVLLLDMSRSMLLRGCFLAAKRVAVALDTLIRTRFPRDELHVIGFAYHAREIRPGALATLSWHGFEYGTNLQHGLMLGRRLLVRSHAANRSIVVITDGEPTAHFQDGLVEFSYPPTRRTIAETLREVARCTREGITINTFMLERSRALTEFVDRMTRLNRGRAFYATPERLGEYVLVDYVGRRTNRS